MTHLSSSDLNLYPHSLTSHNEIEFGLVETSNGKRLAVLSKLPPAGFLGESSEFSDLTLLLCPLTADNAASLRKKLIWLQPILLGLKTSAGMGDRLGLATPGHVRAIRALGAKIAPIFAQQSIRENSRTGREPQQVMDDATWGMFQEGWQEGAGADADHLKEPQDIDTCLAAGYSFFTIDPGLYVDNRAETADQGLLRELADKLPLEVEPASSGLQSRFFEIENISVRFDEVTLLKAAVKYGKAISHVASMYRYLEKAAGSRPFELEVSVDETDQPTTHAEHVYIVSELKRMGVKWVSLAPRYVGSFEKGVDYIGDLKAFERNFAGHAAIARYFGLYKLSLHSGSDKFSIYPVAMQQTRGLIHLKTAGTSYLEALRTIAMLDPEFFHEIYVFARQRYEDDRASYHVSADLMRTPQPGTVGDWPDLLDQFDSREILHVTFGSVLTAKTATHEPRFFIRLMDILRSNSELYADILEKHFVRHLKPFIPLEG